jgi:putative tryptophan/tyrosine transport system substrate-binding protein
MNKVTLWLFAIFLVGADAIGEAQQPTKIPRIGFLIGGSASAVTARMDRFRQGLRELSYVEGKNIVIEWRYGDGKLDHLPSLAGELVNLKVDIIVTSGGTPTRAAKEATSTIPIVMAQDSDPVGSGYVASLAHPGGNVTGLSSVAPELGGKRLELLKETVPKLARVAILGTSTTPGYPQSIREMELAAGTFGLRLQFIDVLTVKDISPAFRAAGKGRADAILLLVSAVLNSQRKQTIDFAIKSRLPAIYYNPEWVEDGGLMSYGVSFTELYRRAATYVDKILKGTKPADLPVEQPTKFELVINLKNAQQIGVTITPNVLARADKVIR